MPVVRHLVADEFGAFIGKYSERLKVSVRGETVQQAPLMHLESVTIIGGGVSISSDAVAACAERGIPILFLGGGGDVSASLYSAGLTGTILTRRQQILAFFDERGLALAGAFATAKMRNQGRTLRYWAYNRRDAHPNDADQLIETAVAVEALADTAAALPRNGDPSASRAALMGYEGSAAAAYWRAVIILAPAAYGWQGRAGRGATDPINSLLNYGYGILYGEIERACLMAGLDPYAGFFHADRPGKPSLVLDLIEEFRQIAVDRTVFGLIARGYQIDQDDTGMLTTDTRRDFARHILHQLEGKVRYGDGRTALRNVVQGQARRVAAFVRDSSAPYEPFIISE